jgi:hypothetical protein
MTTHDIAMDLSYRLLREDEVDSAVDLFELSGWGRPDWLQQFLFGGPLGPGVVVVAVTPTDDVVGMMCFTPYEVQLFDRIAIAGRIRMMVLAPEIRRDARGIHGHVDELDPALRMANTGLRLVQDRGWALTYAFPDPRLVALIDRVGAVDHTTGVERRRSFGALGIQFAGVAPGRIPLDVAAKQGEFGDEYDLLWDQARRNLGIDCAVLRNARALNRVHAWMSTLECRAPRSGELVGYATFLKRPEGALLYDILARDHDSFSDVARSAVNWMRRNSESFDLEGATCLAHPISADALRACGAEDFDWPFILSLRTADRELTPELDPERWYVTAGD